MASTGPDGSASNPSRPSRRGPSPNEEGLRALGATIDQGRRPGDPTAGRRQRALPAAGSPDATSSSTFDESGLEALGHQISGRHRPGHRRTRRYKKTKRVLVGLAAVIIVIGAGTVGYGWYLNHKIHRIEVKGLVDSPKSGADAGTENILMVGSTDRCALTVQNPAYGLCSQGVNGINSDVVMILHLDPNKHTISVLSIPRDLFVPNARTTGANKIDAALYQGPSQLVAVIKEDFGIPIQHYVVLNFDTFANVVQALGGVSMYFPEPVYDAYSGLNVQTTGCLPLNGVQALQVVRARHLQYKGPGVTSTNPANWPSENLSDLARIRRDHEFIRVLATKVAKNGLGNPITDEQLISGVVSQLEVDTKFSASEMVNLLLDFHGVNANSAPQFTLPVQVGQFGSYQYKGGSYGDIEFPSEVQDQQVIDQFLGVSSTTDTMQGGQLPEPASVTVSVLNGTGATNQATTTSASLQALGFQVVGIGDSPPVGTESETVVYYAQMTPTDEAAAQAVAHSLSGGVIMALGPTTDGAQVTVVTGSQFAVNLPAASGTSTSVAGAASTTTAPSSTATTSAANGAFQTASAAETPLQPWDPRSCAASGGEGP